MTTFESVQASVNQLGAARTGLMAGHHSYVAPLLGELSPIDGPSEVHAFGAVGSAQIGMRGKANVGGGLALLGGVSFGQARYGAIDAHDDVTGVFALRYQLLSLGDARPFGEIGGAIGHIGQLHIRRSYMNSGGTAIGEGITQADMWTAYARLGYLWSTSGVSELAVYGEWDHVRQTTGAYIEPLSNSNPFEAHVAAGRDQLNVGKVAVHYTRELGRHFELGLTAAGAHAYDVKLSQGVSVPGFGPVVSGPQTTGLWVEYGARLGYQVNGKTVVSLFVNGESGARNVAPQTHFGIDFSRRF